ncbi:MAG: hypothetical protein ACK53Y_11835, partial [bacterium]
EPDHRLSSPEQRDGGAGPPPTERRPAGPCRRPRLASPPPVGSAWAAHRSKGGLQHLLCRAMLGGSSYTSRGVHRRS